MQTPGALALAEARRHLGYRETPAGSNRTKFGRWYGADGVPWCNIFVSYCFQAGAGVLLCKGFKGPGVKKNRGCAYVPTTEAWLKATGQWIGYQRPQPGDIAIYNWDGHEPDHIGIVEEWLGDGRFRAIEGNTAIGNDSNGGMVMRRIRHVKSTDGFGRIRMADTPQNKKRLAVLRSWILKRRRLGWSWQRIKKTANWREYRRRDGK